MKQKMWIVMALAVMILALWCGSAMAADREVYGTVNVSTLPDRASLTLIDDTTLVIDEDHVLENITGSNFTLTIQGSHNLTFLADGEIIQVKELYSSLSGKILIERVEGGNDARRMILTSQDITILGPIEMVVDDYYRPNHAIESENGNITLTGGCNVIAYHNVIYAPNGSVTLAGTVEATSVANYPAVYAKGNIVLQSGSLKARAKQGVISENGNITLNGNVDIESVWGEAISALNGSITINGTIKAYWNFKGNNKQGDAAVYAKNDVYLNGGTLSVRGLNGIIAGGKATFSGSVSVETFSVEGLSDSYTAGVGIRAETGDIILGGSSNRVYGNNAIEAPKGSVTLHGNLEVGVVSTSGEYAINAKYGIQSDCSSIVKNGPFYGLNGYYYVTQFLPTSGTGTMPPKMCWQGAQITLPGCLFDAPENCRFKCWSNAAHPSLNAGDTVVINGDTNFYAKWERIPRTVTFSPGSGSGTMASLTVGQGEQLTLPACTFNPPSLPGTTYSFDRWKIGASLYNPGSKVTITGNTTVTATWKSDTVLVEFLPNGGTGKMASPILSKGDTYTLPENGFTPPAGQAFVYWDVSSVGYRSPGAVITVLKNTTVKPVWRAAKISFDANGGSGTMDPVVVQASWNGVYTLPACAFTPPANMIFAGWQIGDLIHMAGENWPIYGDKVAKAVWTDKMYTVSFIHGSDSSGTMSPVQVKSGSAYTFPECGFTAPSGKEFAGWLLSGKVYHLGETIPVTGNMQLYAQWRTASDATFTMTFYGDGLLGSMQPITVTNGETVTLPECMFEVPETKRFIYWNVSSIGYRQPGVTITMSQNMTATAVWRNKPLRSVNFKTNGLYQGTLPAMQRVYDGNLAVEPEPLQKDGFIFVGWFTNMTTSESARWDFSTPVTSDLNLYCGFNAIPPEPHPISITTNGHGTVIATFNNTEVQESVKDQLISLIATPDRGYELDRITWTPAGNQQPIPVLSFNRFTMPDVPVAVAAYFKPVQVPFILPASLTSIEDEAFSGIAATAVVIPGSVTSITGNPFAGIDTLTIYGYPGSAAETFANRIPGYTFIPIDDEWMEGQK